METQGSEWGPSRAWVCPAGSILRRSISPFISVQRDLPLLSGDPAVRAERLAWLRPHSWSRPPGPSSCGTPASLGSLPSGRSAGPGSWRRSLSWFCYQRVHEEGQGPDGLRPHPEACRKVAPAWWEEQGCGKILSWLENKFGDVSSQGGAGPKRRRWGHRDRTRGEELKDSLPSGTLD